MVESFETRNFISLPGIVLFVLPYHIFQENSNCIPLFYCYSSEPRFFVSKYRDFAGIAQTYRRLENLIIIARSVCLVSHGLDLYLQENDVLPSSSVWALGLLDITTGIALDTTYQGGLGSMGLVLTDTHRPSPLCVQIVLLDHVPR